MTHTLKTAHIQTPLGMLQAVADEQALYCLQFIDDTSADHILATVQKQTGASVSVGRTAPINSIEQELKLYFNGQLKTFATPIAFIGTPFQHKVWKALQNIPFGQTCSYAQLAQAVAQPRAYRAVGTANGCNNLAIIVPCHRVINASGALGGYAAGLERKEWLLNHEKKNRP